MRRTAALGFAVLALSVVALTGCSGQQHPAAAVATVTATPTTTARPHLLAIGDSIMKGHGLDADEAWPALIAAQRGWTLDNLACDGAGFLTTGDKGDCDETFAGLVDKAVKLQPHTVIVEGSSNDFGESDSALARETFSEITKLHAALPYARIIGLSTVWNETAVPAQLADINEQVEKAVLSVGGRYFDIGQPLAGHPEWMQSDDVHPTARGQQAIEEAVIAAFHHGRFTPAR
jgi:acyl-CoA thioesterase-1